MTAKVNESHKKVYVELGQRIKDAREKKHLSQAGLADASFLSRTSITNIEKGRQHLPLHTLYIIADALGIQVADLLPDQDQIMEKMVLENVHEDLHPGEREWITEITKTTQKKR
jgi:transcriptional regulator with XRE-family HTH domain